MNTRKPLSRASIPYIIAALIGLTLYLVALPRAGAQDMRDTPAVTRTLEASVLAQLPPSDTETPGTLEPSNSNATPPLSNPGQLFTSDVILSLVFLLTVPLTTLVGWLFKLEGATASIVANVVLNFLAKGVTLVVTNQATPLFAAVAFAVGVVLDKTIYDLLTKPKAEKIATLQAENAILARGGTISKPGGE
jgi:hypothetical protein